MAGVGDSKAVLDWIPAFAGMTPQGWVWQVRERRVAGRVLQIDSRLRGNDLIA